MNIPSHLVITDTKPTFNIYAGSRRFRGGFLNDCYGKLNHCSADLTRHPFQLAHKTTKSRGEPNDAPFANQGGLANRTKLLAKSAAFSLITGTLCLPKPGAIH